MATGWEKEWSKDTSELRPVVRQAVISGPLGILFGFYFILLLEGFFFPVISFPNQKYFM